MSAAQFGEIINLNVGGKRFSTSRQTLTWVPDTFFTALLGGRIISLIDETGAIFIDRDPTLFTIVLNYLRSKEIFLPETKDGIRALRHEAEFYGITPLNQRLSLVEDLDYSSCGNVLFYGCLNPPNAPLPIPDARRRDVDTVSLGDSFRQQNHSRHSSLDLRALPVVPPHRTLSNTRSSSGILSR